MLPRSEAINSRGVCVWDKLGAVPASGEIEVTLLGPGYGESVVVHLGNGDWLIVDSCLDKLHPQRTAAPLLYLRGIGVDVEQRVKYIVVSHWDDDHIGGIGDVVEACPNAEFYASLAFSDPKFAAFVEALADGAAYTDGANIQNIRKALHLLHDRGRVFKKAVPARQISSDPIIYCWSPSDLDEQEFLVSVAEMHPQALASLRKAIPRTSNLTSVVLTIEWDGASALLGADMEFSGDNLRGWGAIVSEIGKIGVRPGSLVKIPHHGSETGHDQRMWDILLEKDPISVLTPFGRGALKSRPPKSTDVNRIRGCSGHLYISARHQVMKRPSKMDFGVARSLREGLINITTQKVPMGIVRHRRISGSDWACECFGAAFKVK